LPLQWGENEITAVFGQFGVLTSLRLVRHSVTKHSLGYGFVRYGSVGEAQAAISTLDGTSVLGHTLQVKFADADAGARAVVPLPRHGMPGNADRLWVFENFSRYGAVAGLRILIDEASGLCNGTG
ncbi:hypothetical protein CHLNCDRAFT_26531, partial [Chlorella variabilis]